MSKPAVAYPNEYEAQLQARILDMEFKFSQHEARIHELEAQLASTQDLERRILNIEDLENRITQAKTVLTERSSPGHLITSTMRIKAALEALEGK